MTSDKDMNMPMMISDPDDDFERFLRRQLQAGHDYLPDDGFSARVMAALPAQASRWRERLFIGLPVAIITLLVFSQLPWLNTAYILRAWADQATMMTWVYLGLGVSTCISLAAGAWYWRTTSD